MKTCSPDCMPLCDFCHYFERKPAPKDGVMLDGRCRFHDEPKMLYDDCDDFHCFNLPKPSREADAP